MQGTKALPSPSYKIMFNHLRNWGRLFNWNMRNRVLFDDVYGVPQHVDRLKGKINWWFVTKLYRNLVLKGVAFKLASLTTPWQLESFTLS